MRRLFPPSKWAIVYVEPEATVVVRRTETHSEVIKDHELHYFYPLTSTGQLVSSVSKMPSPEPLLLEIANYLNFRHDPRIAKALVKIMDMSHDRPYSAELISALQKTTELNLDTPELVMLIKKTSERVSDK